MTGAGVIFSITGSSVTYCAGGSGQQGANSATGAAGGANTGSGGGGSGGGTIRAGGVGGSGVVIIAYPNTYAVPTTITGTYNEPTRSGWRVYRFSGSGTITF